MRRSYSLFAKVPPFNNVQNKTKIEIKLPDLPAQLKNVQIPADESEDKSPKEPTLSERDIHRARGFLKYTKPYNPPADLERVLFNVIVEAAPDLNINDKTKENWRNLNLAQTDSNSKFRILTLAEKRLGKTIPNSYLHEIRTVNDLLEFYKVAVSVVAPYNEVARDPKNLPPNLHIIEECVRYDPMRDGPTAFPKRDTKLINPRYRKLYKDIKAKKEWHEFESRRSRPSQSQSAQEEMWSSESAGRFDRIMTMFRLRKSDPHVVR